MKKHTLSLRKLPLSLRLLMSFLLLVTFLTGALLAWTLTIYREDTINRAGESTNMVLQQVAKDINNCMENVETISTILAANRTLTDFFAAKPTFDVMYRNQNTAMELIVSYFFQSDIYAVQLYMPEFVFGGTVNATNSVLPMKTFRNSSLYEFASTNAKTIKWYPTYDYAEMYGLDYLKDRKRGYDYQYLFTAVRQMEFIYVDRGTIHSMPQDATRPILLVHFKADWFGEQLKNILPFNGIQYWVLDEQNRVAYSNDMSELGHVPKIVGLTVRDAYSIVESGGEQTLLCSSTLPVNDWRVVAAIPLSAVTGETFSGYLKTLALWVLFAWLFAGLLSLLFIQRFTRPVNTLINALEQVSKGDLNVRAPTTSVPEFLQITNSFNSMCSHIQRLIRENYEMRLRKTEAELMSLNLQVNPHFLGNTLNVINLTALQNGQDEISRMIGALSSMLHYAVSDHRDLVPLDEELQWLDAYNLLMKARFEDMYELRYDIPQALRKRSVPKLILQPIVENAFLHGKIGSKRGGWISVSVRDDGGALCLMIENNGVDIARDARWQDGESGHIGLANVRARLTLLYGDASGMTAEPREGGGTRVTLLLSELNYPTIKETSN